MYGDKWFNGSITEDVVLRRVVFNNERFIAVGDNGVIYNSVDGKEWEKQVSPLKKSEHIFGIGFDNKNTLIGACRNGVIIGSYDNGKTWKVLKRNVIAGSEDLYTAIYGNGIWLLTGETGSIVTSTDNGRTWKVFNSKKSIRCSHFANGFFIFGCSNGDIYKTTDGLKLIKVASIGIAVRGMTYSNNLWVGSGRSIVTSTDGEKWIVKKQLIKEGIKDQLYCASSFPVGYIVSGEHGITFTSNDGIVWNKKDIGTKRFIFDLAFGNNVLVAIGNGGKRANLPEKSYLYSTHYSLG